jgi:capsular polysaccharide biosynthesis protein
LTWKEETAVELREYWRVLRRRAWIPIALTVLAAAGASALTFLSEPEYTATATVVAKAPPGGSPITFAQVATSNSVALKVQKELNLDNSVDQIKSQIRVSPVGNDVYKLSVSDSDSTRAAAIANAAAVNSTHVYQDKVGPAQTSIAALERARVVFRKRWLDALQAWVEYRSSRPNTPSAFAQELALEFDKTVAATALTRIEEEIDHQQIMEATNPSSTLASVIDEAAPMPDTTERLLRIVYAAGLAVVLGIAVILMLEYFDQSVRSAEEVEQLVGAPVLGVIPHAKLRPIRQAWSGLQ